jgi:hypothetical protein
MYEGAFPVADHVMMLALMLWIGPSVVQPLGAEIQQTYVMPLPGETAIADPRGNPLLEAWGFALAVFA